VRGLIKKWFNLDFYISGIDRFLEAFRKKHPRLSASQRAEMEKYAALNKQRDVPEKAVSHKKVFWKNF
jgi:hypothetical protein